MANNTVKNQHSFHVRFRRTDILSMKEDVYEHDMLHWEGKSVNLSESGRCVHACMHACVRACMRACGSVCVHVLKTVDMLIVYTIF